MLTMIAVYINILAIYELKKNAKKREREEDLSINNYLWTIHKISEILSRLRED